jgi:hypothetical protein
MAVQADATTEETGRNDRDGRDAKTHDSSVDTKNKSGADTPQEENKEGV